MQNSRLKVGLIPMAGTLFAAKSICKLLFTFSTDVQNIILEINIVYKKSVSCSKVKILLAWGEIARSMDV